MDFKLFFTIMNKNLTATFTYCFKIYCACYLLTEIKKKSTTAKIFTFSIPSLYHTLISV